MTDYSQRQKGKTAVIILSIPLVVMLVLLSRGLSQVESFLDVWQLALGSILVLTGMIFMSSLKVTVGSGILRIDLGPGHFGKKIPLSDISEIERTTIPWYSSGIKRIRNGWLFSVDGSPGLEITLNSGKRYIIGTDDPDGLEKAIKNITEKSSNNSSGKDLEI